MSGLAHFHSPLGLHPFQAEDVARSALQDVAVAVWDCGVGKSVLALALIALLYEDDLIDQAIIVAEKNKITADEWPSDAERFTDLTWGLYHGTKVKRGKVWAAQPQILITTYETLARDGMELRKDPDGVRRYHAIGPVLDIQDRRVLIVYDEGAAKLKNRRGNNKWSMYGAHKAIADLIRKQGHYRALGLTATPMEKGPLDTYNFMRVLDPKGMPKTKQFDDWYVAAVDMQHKPVRYCNVGKIDRPNVKSGADEIRPFSTFLAPYVIRRRKTDPELVDQFPKRIEEFTHLKLSDIEYDFYNTVQDTFTGESEWEARQLFTLLRMIALDPKTLLMSDGKFAKQIVDIVGPDGLKAIGSSKTERIVEYVAPLVQGQGAQAMVFSFFTSYLHWLQQAFTEAGVATVLHHGQMTSSAQTEAKMRFKDGEVPVFLTSDAGARGLNFPNSLYTVQAELPLTHSNYIQRMDRNHRITTEFPSVTNRSFVALDTCEEGIEILGHRRNEWNDELLGDEDDGSGFITAEHRRLLNRISRNNPVGATT